MTRTITTVLIVFLAACSDAVDVESTPEYWAEIIMTEGPTDEVSQRLRAMLEGKPREERNEFIRRVQELRGLNIQYSEQETEYVSYEENAIDFVQEINRLSIDRSEEALSSQVSRAQLLLQMLNSPFRSYDDTVVSLIPDVSMSELERRQYQLVKTAMDYLADIDFLEMVKDGTPLMVTHEGSEARVAVGGLLPKGLTPRAVEIYVVLDGETGEATGHEFP